MNDRVTSPCDNLIEYLTGESMDVDRKRFEKHLATCATCQEEAVLWRQVWDRLSEDAELLELPADLKEEVLGPILKKDSLTSGPIISARNTRKAGPFAKWAMGAAIVAAVFSSGWLIGNRQSMVPERESSVRLPDNIETVFHLSADRSAGQFANNARAYGVACFVRTGQGEQLVVYVFGTPRTKGEEAYHVWLLKDGQRTSAGTFTVGESGIGIMTLPLGDQELDTDAVGVTLEPDSHSLSPRGPKMFGSDKQESPGQA
ncbi:anti-sigma factor [Cohnella lupini]|uniref:Regulator of SigK n=1 Tax=Cohnella lupini TaxID=1294267 RepID=A0A3D9IEY7_9BACL|nr:anti-sigma factor [Cohnella lupini]RED60270.1 anti-sigma-K factor rskA [Cohnella lupini]